MGALAILLAFLTGLHMRAEGHWKSYTSPDGGYSVTYPDDWNHYSESRGLYILNFPEDRIVPQSLLPKGGAMISFARPRRPMPRSVDKWIRRDAVVQHVVASRGMQVAREGISSQLALRETTAESKFGTLAFEQVNWYFSVNGRLFCAVLLHHKGDPRRERYRAVLEHVVASLRCPEGPADGTRDSQESK